MLKQESFDENVTHHVQVDNGLVLEPKLSEVSNDLNVNWRVGCAVHSHRQQQVMSWSRDFRIHDPHFDSCDRDLTNLKTNKQKLISKIPGKKNRVEIKREKEKEIRIKEKGRRTNERRGK